MTDKEKYTNRLMDAVGDIDERYIYEAQNYTPKKRMPGYVKAIIAAAASMFLIIGAALPLLFSLYIMRISKSGSDFNVPEEEPRQQITQSLSKSNVETYEILPDIKGAAVIWRTDENGYSYVSVSESKAESLIESIGSGSDIPEKDDGVRIWIKTDSGEYVSPQLKRSPGNVDCAIFEYSPEIAISDKTAQMIADIINERG